MSDPRASFHEFVTTQLNEHQQKAVLYKNGPLLIVAGAGSGKTRVITTRITHLLLHENVSPTAIVALTFTNKAAHEMRERITKFLPSSRDLPFIGTFHAYCLRLLKQNMHLLGSPFNAILDEDDQHKIIQNILHRAGLNKKITAKQIAYQISALKSQTINPASHSLYQYDSLLREMYHAYEQEKQHSKCLDFDDLLLETVHLFQKNPAFKTIYQERVRHILVDEYQDTNIVQHELLKQMALHEKKFMLDSLCAVGDEDQSIYSWRGATVSNIMNFTTDFPKTALIKIEQNYRSVQPILDLANTIIQNNKNRNPKTLWSDKKGHDRIRLLACASEYQEAETIAQFLKCASKHQKLSSIAILYRTHFQSRTLEEALLKHSIAYKIIGGIQFYERKEIKDMLAYLKLIANPSDRPSFFRVINCPLRGLGLKFEEQFYDAWHQEPFLSFHEVAQKFIENSEITGIKKEALVNFIALFKDRQATDAPRATVQHIINHTNYFNYLKESYDSEDAIAKIENIKELLNALDHLESQEVTTITRFLEEVALMQEQIQAGSTEKDPVMLMTLHAAKGLEFHTIILTGLEEGLLPSSRSLVDDELLEEERRLFYVGITRAQERLLLLQSKHRYTYGTLTDQRPSRFVLEMPSTSAPMQDCSYWHTVHFQQFFSEWISGTTPAKAVTEKKYTQEKMVSLEKPISSWKKNQPVTHTTFGIGIVQDIEQKSNTTYLQVKFKTGLKKVAAQFLKTV